MIRDEWWRASAPCASTDPELFFPEGKEQAPHAKRICAACPYSAPCLLGAMERREQFGVWGGVAARQFRYVRRSLEVAA